MNTFYVTFPTCSVLRKHILKILAVDEKEVRELLAHSHLLKYSWVEIYDESRGEELITRYKYTVIKGSDI